MNEAIWLSPSIGEEAQILAAKLNVPASITQIMVNRNIKTVPESKAFLFGTLSDLPDPFLLAGMKIAVERVKTACEHGEKILIFGDYDVDGVLSVVVLTRALERLGGKVEHFIPDRLSQGYGIKESYVDIVLEKKAKLVISVDCGIKAVDFVDCANRNGIDVIITDHHQPGSALPRALTVLNPVLEGANYPDKHLAGIGVVFKLIQALFEEEGFGSDLPHYLKLVAIGTVADVAPLIGENRLFVKHGLDGLSNVSNPGLKNLMDVCRLTGKKVTAGDVGFRIGPRVNAAGRLGKAEQAVGLFLSRDEEMCREVVLELDKMNAQRQKVEEKIWNQALQVIKKRSLQEKYRLLILGCDGWHRGVIGIVASKLKDLFHRPVILFAFKDGRAFGSGRSIKEFSLIECLELNRDHFLSYGGHPLAIGCELELDRFDSFRSAVNNFAESAITDEDLKRKIPLDVQLRFDQIDNDFLGYLSLLSPFGVGNRRPLFLTLGAEVLMKPQKIQGKHSKFIFKQSGKIFEALGWNKGKWAELFDKGDRLDLAYSLQISEYLGEERLNLSLEDVRRG
jgi:single-stranded-DNA-specific exonuclease